MLFWLVYLHGKRVEVVVQPASHLLQARLSAQLAGQSGEFREGHKLDAKTAKKVPKAMIGRALNAAEAAALLKMIG
jgi:hypothetical protein